MAQASLEDLGFARRKRTEDDGLAQELIIHFRPDVKQAEATRGATFAASIASRPAPNKRPVGRGRGRSRGRGLKTLGVSEDRGRQEGGGGRGGNVLVALQLVLKAPELVQGLDVITLNRERCKREERGKHRRIPQKL
jgi:hypothetical protein